MDALIIKETIATPKVVFDLAKSNFEIYGCSRPEDVRDFYKPIIDYLLELPHAITEELILKYSIDPLVFNIKFDYFNSSSAKFILDILALINDLHKKGLNLQINWHFDENDDDMKEVGEELSEVVDFPFKYIIIDKNKN